MRAASGRRKEIQQVPWGCRPSVRVVQYQSVGKIVEDTVQTLTTQEARLCGMILAENCGQLAYSLHSWLGWLRCCYVLIFLWNESLELHQDFVAAARARPAVVRGGVIELDSCHLQISHA